MTTQRIHGILAEFDSPEGLLHASRQAYGQGYRRMDAYAPFPVEGLAESMRLKRSKIPLVFLAAGLLGGVGGFLLQYYIAKYYYPINVGGRPLNSWPMFIPITFELTVLLAGVIGFAAMLAMSNLPKPYHPVFNSPSFTARASRDRFYLCIEADDPMFNAEKTKSFLSQLDPKEVSEIED